MKPLVGSWQGYFRSDRGGAGADHLTLIVQENGIYQVSNPKGGTGLSAQITIANGKATYQGTRSSGVVRLFSDGTLRIEGSNAYGTGYTEWERTK